MRISRTLIIACFLAAPHLACTNNNNNVGPSADFFVNAGQGFLLRVGDTVGVNGGQLVVSFANVLSDNRCPVDVECVQAGAAVIQLTIESLQRQDTVNVEVPPGAGIEFTFDEFVLNVVQLEPDTSTTDRPPIVEYVAGIIVSNAP